MADNTIDGFHTTNVPGDYTGAPAPVYTLAPDFKRLQFLAADNPNSGTGITFYSAGAVTTGKAYMEWLLTDIASITQDSIGIMTHSAGPEALEFTTFPRAGVYLHELLGGSSGTRAGSMFNYPGSNYGDPGDRFENLFTPDWGTQFWVDGCRFGIAIDADARTVRMFIDDVELPLRAWTWDAGIGETRLFISGRAKFDVSLRTTAEDLADSAAFQALQAEGYTPWVYVPPPPPIDCCPPLPQRTDPGCGDTSCGREFGDKTLSWSDSVKTDGEYTFPESRLYPIENVYVSAPVGRETQEYRLTLGSVLWAPLTIVAVDWSGQYFNNARRK